ncbi:hypothetical protein [Cerasicoccus arenae]|uniref:PEP-CTERM protein-sorting domain-containing protein n=1 Tax=Cerasicoccus arenae TaxID=424488 RepID=A0A8J3GDH2_9BACT|nr:hypothetical protein [Cerasicoccus arenae]MBK1859960.1 hypothetical protein [Cerasicoccus arenae]GHC01497.1 hypothetical protein GCM10007047_17480 [Cerasicoccus arenae]
MKTLLTTCFICLSSLSASAAFITYTDGITNVNDGSGPAWVGPTVMFKEIINDYAGAPSESGASGATQTGFSLFDPGGGGLDITLLTWSFGPMDLLGVGVGDSVTQSPGPASPGYEDYRYDDLGLTAPTNLTFSYNGVEWATGYITEFLIEVPNNADPSAVGSGSAVLTANSVAGQAFMDEIAILTGGTFDLDFVANDFNSLSGVDPATFSSTGQINFVPEPGSTAAGMAVLILSGVMIWRRRQST